MRSVPLHRTASFRLHLVVAVFSTLFVASCGGSAPPSGGPVVVKVPNGDFESGSLEPWTPFEKVTATVTSEAMHGGRFALAEASGQGSLYLDVTGLTPGAHYLVTAVASASDPKQGARIGSWSEDLNVATFTNVPPGNGWRQVSHPISPGKSGTMRIHLFRDEGPQVVYWDDVTLSTDAANK